MSLLKKLFGGTSVDFATLVKQGAMIIDVRSPAEYKGGHIKGSVNIPLQSLQASLSKVPKNKAIITCCASGMRSGSAKSILKAAGYNVHNGGGWMSLKSKIWLFVVLDNIQQHLFHQMSAVFAAHIVWMHGVHKVVCLHAVFNKRLQ